MAYQDQISKNLKLILQKLSYNTDAGYLNSEEFTKAHGAVHGLLVSKDKIAAVGAFGLWSKGIQKNRGSKFRPIVLVSTASSDDEAKDIHKMAWNQGLVPFLLIVGTDKVWICNSFHFSGSEWLNHVTIYNINEFTEDTAKPTSKGNKASKFYSLHAKSIKQSIVWQDLAKESDEYVDKRLLRSLLNLSKYFLTGDQSLNLPSLQPNVVTALIGRLLYVYVLHDRGYIFRSFLEELNIEPTAIETSSSWDLESFWSLIDLLDAHFNGSVFPMEDELRAQVTQCHFDKLRSIIRGGASAYQSGSLQLSFFDYEFSVIRTETLSAVYELFLVIDDAEDKHKKGAYYTPPFLADYILDRVEDSIGSFEGKKIYDPAAGSGIFLVAVFRRLIEERYFKSNAKIDLITLHEMMQKHIFAAELNETACQVAAFSLYLTMLDYCDEEQVRSVLAKGNSKKLFPEIIGKNIAPGDFFLDERNNFDLIIGNPPWTGIRKLDSEAAINFASSIKQDYPFDGAQAAHLFFWKSLLKQLKNHGHMALIIPANAIYQDNSADFRKAITDKYRILGAVDFSHLRYHLFRAAMGSKKPRASACCLFMQKTKSKQEDHTWIYQPKLSSIPLMSHRDVWVLTHDWETTTWVKQHQLKEENDGWSLYVNMEQIDRHILAPIIERLKNKTAINLGQFIGNAGILEIRGKSAAEWGVEIEDVITPKNILNTNASGHLFNSNRDSYIVQPNDHRYIAKNDEFGLHGMTVLPRALEYSEFLSTRSKLFSSSYILYTFDDLNGDANIRRRVLSGLSKYFNSRIFNYQARLLDGRYMRDRGQISQSTANSIISPFKSLEDEIFKKLETQDDVIEIENIFMKSLGINCERDSEFIEEFMKYRIFFKDGQTPKISKNKAAEKQLLDYKKTVENHLNNIDEKFEVEIFDKDISTYCLVTFKQDGVSYNSQEYTSQKAIAEMEKHGLNQYTCSRFVWDDVEHLQTLLVKPKDGLYWSKDKAFDDALRLEAQFLM